MSLFNFTQDIAIDLGTANTIIISNGEIVVDEPSVVAIRKADDKMIAVGKKAAVMQDRDSPSSRIYTVRPLQKGVIADYKACEMLIRGLIDMIPHRPHLIKPNVHMVVCVPSGATPQFPYRRESVGDASVHYIYYTLKHNLTLNSIFL